jgi:hypothetical protein
MEDNSARSHFSANIFTQNAHLNELVRKTCRMRRVKNNKNTISVGAPLQVRQQAFRDTEDFLDPAVRVCWDNAQLGLRETQRQNALNEFVICFSLHKHNRRWEVKGFESIAEKKEMDLAEVRMGSHLPHTYFIASFGHEVIICNMTPVQKDC